MSGHVFLVDPGKVVVTAVIVETVVVVVVEVSK